MSHSLYISKNLCKGYLAFLRAYTENHVKAEARSCEEADKPTNFHTLLKERREDRTKLQLLTLEFQELLGKWEEPNLSSVKKLTIEGEIAVKYSECEETIRWLNLSWE